MRSQCVTIDIAINILKNEFQSSPRYEDQNFQEKISEKFNSAVIEYEKGNTSNSFFWLDNLKA